MHCLKAPLPCLIGGLRYPCGDRLAAAVAPLSFVFLWGVGLTAAQPLYQNLGKITLYFVKIMKTVINNTII